MTRLARLVAVAFAAAVCNCGIADATPQAPAGQSTAIAVEGDYVYVVENGSVYKLSSKDLKPVASARLSRTKPATATKTRAVRPARKRKVRLARRRSSTRAHTTWRRVPVATKTKEAGLPE